MNWLRLSSIATLFSCFSDVRPYVIFTFSGREHNPPLKMAPVLKSKRREKLTQIRICLKNN